MVVTVLRSSAQLLGMPHRTVAVRPFTTGAPHCVRQPRSLAPTRSAFCNRHTMARVATLFPRNGQAQASMQSSTVAVFRFRWIDLEEELRVVRVCPALEPYARCL